MNPIPTKYAGVQFRSRLEARWAVFFDLIGWKWEYEPIDLNGYIPDFVLNFRSPLIVEIKPLMGSPWDWEKTQVATEALQKIVQSGWRGEGLLLGSTIFSEERNSGWVEYGDPVNAGLLFDSTLAIGDCHEIEPRAQNDARELYCNPFGFKKCCQGPVDVVGSFHCRKCGAHDKGPSLVDSDALLSKWREAGNRVQWRAPR